MKFLFLVFQICLTSIPYKYMMPLTSEHSEDNMLESNEILDIEVLYNSNIIENIYLSSAGGLGKSPNLNDGYSFQRIIDDMMVQGGNPALSIRGDIIAVSGSVGKLELGKIMPFGTGVSYSVDAGQTWRYMPQPKDIIGNGIYDEGEEFTDLDNDGIYDEGEEFVDVSNKWSCSNHDAVIHDTKEGCELECQTCPNSQGQTSPSSCANLYNFISWANQTEIKHLLVTTEINNLAYDLEIHENYIYSANWAGGLRRFDYTSDEPEWESIPLPLDNQIELNCGGIPSTYQLNPVGDCGSENFNHRPFSVHAIGDNLWVGTAGGINKGTFNETYDDCIDWEHLRFYEGGFYDDWIIGFENQELADGSNRIWALTWDKDSQGEVGPPSFSDDGGVSWNYSTQLDYLGVKAYNISFNEDLIYLSAKQGLFISEDGEFWEKFDSFIDTSGQQILSNVVYDAKVIDDKLWVATQDGIAISENASNPYEWLIFRFWDNNKEFSAYPNPFLINDYNVLDGQGHVRFVSNSTNSQATVDVFDFSMDKVITLDSPIIVSDQIEFIWNGQTEYGNNVHNGIYFCRLNDRGQYSWFKLAVLSGS